MDDVVPKRELVETWLSAVGDDLSDGSTLKQPKDYTSCLWSMLVKHCATGNVIERVPDGPGLDRRSPRRSGELVASGLYRATLLHLRHSGLGEGE